MIIRRKRIRVECDARVERDATVSVDRDAVNIIVY